jgi:alcohol dehydrogenase class IV
LEQRALVGKISIDQFSSLLYDIRPKKIFLVRGKESYESCGAKYFIESSIAKPQCRVYEFFEFETNPKNEDVEKGLTRLTGQEPDIIIAAGGGSVIDTAKLVRFFYSYNGNITGNNFEKRKELIPLIALPTTAGTGSEATHFAVVYKDKVKYSIAHADIVPDICVVNPIFTYNNPKYLAACSGFDALAQGIEAYWNIHATEESDNYALKAIELIFENLPLSVNLKIKESMDKVSEGSYWAGKAINITKTTAPHAMSYAFTAHYGIPHGTAVALTFPFFMKYNTHIGNRYYRGVSSREKHDKKMDILFSVLRINKPDYIVRIFRNYIKALGLRLSVEFNNETIIRSINRERMDNNPKRLSKEDIYAVLDYIQYGVA